MMDNLVQKLNWDMPFIKNQCMFVYADADLDSNQKMQEPLQKLYQYENQPIKNELKEYKNKIFEAILEHFENPYCARTDAGEVIYQREIIELINRIE